jgi:glycosyltransferase involved in cell wall biosynthesis
MKVALVYDRVNKWGGAERVLLALHRIFPSAPLFTSVYNPRTASWARVFPKVFSSFLQNLPVAKKRHEIYAPLMPIAFESFSFDDYDVVISVTSEAAKGIITKPKTLHICYCLTPTRYLWSGYDDYFRSKFLSTISKPVIYYLRKWDEIAAFRPDYFIAISKEVQQRIRSFYKRDSEVVYPPVDSLFFQETNKERFRREPYFLLVSRLVPYKRIDIVIDAFNKTGFPLKIVGSGSDYHRLRRIAKKNVEFITEISDRELLEYYKNAQAFVFAGVEDFGLSMVEAQAAGTPVIAFFGGGAREIVIPGRTGEFFYEQRSSALLSVLEKFDPRRYNRDTCSKNAKRFSEQIFEKEFKKLFNRLVSEYFKV